MSNSELFNIISKQTGIDDFLLIERAYYECDSDTTKTIFKLLEIELPELRNKRSRDVFDDLRDICDEKDTIFQEVLKKNREQQELNGIQSPIIENIEPIVNE
jgi:hypothetical protein